MTYFQEHYIQFFQDLAKNNNADWFKTNKGRYEVSVKQPFEKLVTDVMSQIQKLEPNFPTFKTSELIHRINRDLRFSKDKSPYKTNMSAIFNKDGKKSETPGFYFHFSTTEAIVCGGCYTLSPNNLAKVRKKITDYPDALDAILNDTDFSKYFHQIEGEKLTKAPKGMQKAYEAQQLVANKQFYVVSNLPINTILQTNLLDKLLAHYKALAPLHNFLESALAG